MPSLCAATAKLGGHNFVLSHRSSTHDALVEALMTMLTEKREFTVSD